MILEDHELKELKSYIPKLLKSDLYKDRKFECCPYCGGSDFIKYGHYNQIQRYRCSKCRRTFSKTTNSLWYCSKKDPYLWSEFIELFLERKSLRYCAEALGISVVTAFYWRHKVMNLLKLSSTYGINPKKLKGDTFVTCARFQEKSLNSTINFKLDPYSKQNNIFIFAARGEEDSMITIPIGRNIFFSENFKEDILSRIDKESYVIVWKKCFMELMINEHNKKLHRKTKLNPSQITEFQVTSEKWFTHFHGVASKYLNDYLSYFILFNLNRCFKPFEFTYSLIKEFNFIKTDEIKKIQLNI